MNKKFLIGLLLLSQFVSAEQVTIQVDGNLSERQKAELSLKANELVGDDKKEDTAKKIKEYVDIGTAIGTGLASSAKEIGVAANDFANSPVGKFTVFLIGWHYFGEEFVRIIFGFIWLLIMIPLWTHLYKRERFRTIIEYNTETKIKSKIKKSQDITGEKAFTYWFTALIIMFVGILPILI